MLNLVNDLPFGNLSLNQDNVSDECVSTYGFTGWDENLVLLGRVSGNFSCTATRDSQLDWTYEKMLCIAS